MDDSGFKHGVVLGYLAVIFRGGHQSRASFVRGGDFNPFEKYAQVKLDHFPNDPG